MPRRAFPVPLLWAFVPYALASTIYVALLTAQGPLADPTKLILMPLLAIPVLLAAPRVQHVALAIMLTYTIGRGLIAAGTLVVPRGLSRNG